MAAREGCLRPLCAAADALGVSTATVEREWAMAKAWLHQRLSKPQEPSAG
jgi:hypothetical protein